MAQKTYNSVVYFRIAGAGIVPGIVIKTRLEQQKDNSLAEVLTLLYAHPKDEANAHHQAIDIGDTAFSVYPLRNAGFGWADTLEAFDAKPLPVAPPPQEAVPLGLSDGHGGWTREGSDVPLTPASVVTHVPVVVDQNPGGAVVAHETVVEGAFGYLDAEGGILPPHIPAAAEHDAAPVEEPGVLALTPADVVPEEPVEVFADPEGKTIGVPDGAGGYTHIRDNPFPPDGTDHEGKPIK